MSYGKKQHMIQHKMLVPQGSQPNFYLAKNSFMLGILNKFCLTFN
jgi:hypothetical protein